MKDSDSAYENGDNGIQICGVLLKKPFGHQSNKWAKRFFLVKDGFLLYYPENEKKEFEKRKHFNIHPRGCIALGECVISSVVEPGHPFSLNITNDSFLGTVIIATESAYERDKWINVLNKSTKITWKNVEFGDALIKQLEHQGLKMAEEKQNYFDQLQNEVMALHDEKLKTEELEKVKDELAKENEKMEKLSQAMKDEYEKIKVEMAETAEAMKTVEDERSKLNQKTDELQLNLEELELEKQRTLRDLDERFSETKRLSFEHSKLSETTEALRLNLEQIEERTIQLQNEMALAEERLKDKIEEAENLEEEKNAIYDHAEELKESMQELAAQKEITEAELKEEILARINAEKRLKEAEESLLRLGRAVEDQSQNVEEPVLEEMTQDVRTLKKFFENLAFEAKLDKDKPIMIKNAVHARKTYVRRAKTLKYEEKKKRRTATGCMNLASTLTLPGEFHHFSSLDDLTSHSGDLLDGTHKPLTYMGSLADF